MDCREAQSLYTAFIDQKLDIDKTEEFIQHIETCSNCRDEIEVYFIVYSGIRQLDNEEEDISDFQAAFKKMLQEKKDEIYHVHRARKRKRIALTAFIVFLVMLASGVALFYVIDRERYDAAVEYAHRSFAEAEGEVYYKQVEYTLNHNKWDGEVYQPIIHNTTPQKEEKSSKEDKKDKQENQTKEKKSEDPEKES